MKRTEYFKPRAAARLVLAAACILVLAAACTTDDDPLRPDAADDRPVPFTFTAVAPPAMTDANTRAVTGNDRWKGDSTEKIKVFIYDNDANKSSTGTYTVISPDGKTAVLPGDEPALWASKGDNHEVYAWYPALEPGKEYDISDQSTPEKFRQADVLRAVANRVTPYNTTPVLEFGHEMGKIRVVLTGVDASVTDIEVGIQSDHTLFHLSELGRVIGSDGLEDYITACRDTKDANVVAFEALLPAIDRIGEEVSIMKQNLIRIRTGGQTYYFSPELYAQPEELWAGYLYTYHVTLPPATTTTTARHITLPPGAVVTRARSR